MNDKCLFCNGFKKSNRPKFCSVICVKRAWYLKRHPNSFFSNSNKDFWDSQTGIGFKWEKYIAKKLGAEHLIFNKNGGDLLLDNKIIDVKASGIYRRKFKRGKPVIKPQNGVWSFKRGKIKPIDFFCCVCVDEDKPIKILMIPHNIFPQSGLVIGKNSIYDKYII